MVWYSCEWGWFCHPSVWKESFPPSLSNGVCALEPGNILFPIGVSPVKSWTRLYFPSSLSNGACALDQVILCSSGTGTSCKKNFQTGFVVAGWGFLAYWNHQLIKFEEEKRFGQFCNYENRKINTFENFPYDFFPCKTSFF